MKNLKLNSEIHKILISSSSRFVGQYQSEDISINISHPNGDALGLGLSESPYYRTYLVISFRYKHDGQLVIRDLSMLGEMFCSLLSLLYGKEFKFHGMLEAYGIYRLPVIEGGINYLHDYPEYNFKPRIDLEIPLNLEKFSLIVPLMLDKSPVSADLQNLIIAASKFYNRALQIFPVEKELAFLDLVTSGEIISNFDQNDYSEEQLYDEQLLKKFDEILKIDGGEIIVKDLKKRLFQVKRKFVYGLSNLLNDSFFRKTEINEQSENPLTKENIEITLKAAYDLRSKYVHSGLEFGPFIIPEKVLFNELTIFNAKELGKETSKVISKSPTFLGLERVIRYSLLKLIHKNGIHIHQDLD